MDAPYIIAKVQEELIGLVPEPVLAHANPPEWFRHVPSRITLQGRKDPVPTIKKCLPTLDAISAGILIPLVCDIEISDKGWSWDWKPPVSKMKTRLNRKEPVSSHPGYQVKGTPLELEPGKAFVVWTNYWMFEMPPGWGLLFTHPNNRENLPFFTLPGFIDVNNFDDFAPSFSSRWVDPNFRGVLKKGTPIAQAFPVPVAHPELTVRAFTDEETEHQRKLALQNPAEIYKDRRRKARVIVTNNAPER